MEKVDIVRGQVFLIPIVHIVIQLAEYGSVNASGGGG